MSSTERKIHVIKEIADIEGMDIIQESHIKEAFQYRGFDKFLERYR